MKPSQKEVVIGCKSFDAMWAAVAAECEEQEPPEGSMCTDDFIAKFGGKRSAVAAMLERRVESGLATKALVRRRRGDQVREITYYSLSPRSLVKSRSAARR